MNVLSKIKDAFLNACIRTHAALNSRKGSQTVEVLVIVLIVIIVGGILLAAFRWFVPNLADRAFVRVTDWFTKDTGSTGGPYPWES